MLISAAGVRVAFVINAFVDHFNECVLLVLYDIKFCPLRTAKQRALHRRAVVAANQHRRRRRRGQGHIPGDAAALAVDKGPSLTRTAALHFCLFARTRRVLWQLEFCVFVVDKCNALERVTKVSLNVSRVS